MGLALAPSFASAVAFEPVKRAVDLPPSADLSYTIKARQKGFSLGGDAVVNWRLTGSKYSFHSDTKAALFGSLIGDPKAIGIDVLLPVYFLGLVMGFRKRHNFLPVLVAGAVGSVVAYWVVGSPWHISVGAALGIVVAAILPPPGASDHDVKDPALETEAA